MTVNEKVKASRTILLRGLLLLALCVPLGIIGSPPSQAANDVPKFVDYPAKISTTKRVPLRLSADDRLFRTRLRNAYKEPVNFAGKYVVTVWGCGTECLVGAALNVTTGRVSFFPGTVCCFSELSIDDSGFEPVIFRKNSRLLVLTGRLNEDGNLATSFFTIENDRWVLRASIER